MRDALFLHPQPVGSSPVCASADTERQLRTTHQHQHQQGSLHSQKHSKARLRRTDLNAKDVAIPAFALRTACLHSRPWRLRTDLNLLPIAESTAKAATYSRTAAGCVFLHISTTSPSHLAPTPSASVSSSESFQKLSWARNQERRTGFYADTCTDLRVLCKSPESLE